MTVSGLPNMAYLWEWAEEGKRRADNEFCGAFISFIVLLAIRHGWLERGVMKNWTWRDFHCVWQRRLRCDFHRENWNFYDFWSWEKGRKRERKIARRFPIVIVGCFVDVKAFSCVTFSLVLSSTESKSKLSVNSFVSSVKSLVSFLLVSFALFFACLSLVHLISR